MSADAAMQPSTEVGELVVSFNGPQGLALQLSDTTTHQEEAP
jgi:hypothetical protein